VASNAFEKFRKSMSIGYMQWHEGIGYDHATALVFVVGALLLFGCSGTSAGLVKAFTAMGGESVDPSQKARILAEGIAQAMNCTAFGTPFGVPSAIVLALLTRKRG
jgi:hypothetical protein